MDVEIVRVSSRGQFVLPLSMRKRNHIAEGEKLMVIDDGRTIVVRPVKSMKDDIQDEIWLMHKAAEGWKDIEDGKFKRMGKAEFLKELSGW
ncbi:TPA: AbrB/MazE/SpoVT family DNA-binding domain-containing protein [Candidatus Micrarchaeota archaeon]|nr:AbrB/MazE/SpoVT family DNA-binding domain-containing protein [Candidatus Micrarchaeota archaeon]HIH30631.1 AbrB/MazE/SpoVT family DNA-binding domain-containing protein [Candidatus Micrarchaeota archaeon]